MLAKNHGGREFMKGLDRIPKQCRDLIVSSSEFTECLRLLFKDFSDGFNRVTGLELDG